jgi:hypothetical protein
VTVFLRKGGVVVRSDEFFALAIEGCISLFRVGTANRATMEDLPPELIEIIAQSQRLYVATGIWWAAQQGALRRPLDHTGNVCARFDDWERCVGLLMCTNHYYRTLLLPLRRAKIPLPFDMLATLSLKDRVGGGQLSSGQKKTLYRDYASLCCRRLVYCNAPNPPTPVPEALPPDPMNRAIDVRVGKLYYDCHEFRLLVALALNTLQLETGSTVEFLNRLFRQDVRYRAVFDVKRMLDEHGGASTFTYYKFPSWAGVGV